MDFNSTINFPTCTVLLLIHFLLFAFVPKSAAYIQQPFAQSLSKGQQTDTLVCPSKCECEQTSNGINLHKESVAIYCHRGGLNDSDLLNILHTISNPHTVQILDIRAPSERPNTFQWNDNVNRFSMLRKLVLSNCGIPALSQSIRLPNLIHMDLSGNRIDQLQIGSFIGAPLVESLDLSHNHIHTLPTSAFLYLKKLRRLSLSHNQLNDLPASLLRGPSALMELELDGNKLKAKQLNDLFTDVAELTRLEINNCGLNDEQVNALQLQRVPMLRRLGIAGNNLTFVPSTNLRALELLDTLDLRYNSIKVLGPCAFCSCNISRVLLGYNLLGLTPNSIDPESFADTHMLELDLSHNFFDQFDSQILANAQHTLKILHLSKNSLQGFHGRLVHTLPKLTHLHLAGNQISSIPYLLPKTYAQLRLLNLSGNVLEDLPTNMPGMLPWLTTLDLSYNRFSSLSSAIMSSFIERLEQAYLHHNPWDCQCAVQNLQQYMLQRLSYRNVLDYEHTTCAKPALLKGQPLHRVQKINDCAVLFGSTYGLTQASELLLLLAALLVAAFLVSLIVIILLYCGREHKQKAVYVTREHSRTRLTGPPLDVASAGGSTNSGAPSSLLSEPLTSPSALLLPNGNNNNNSINKCHTNGHFNGTIPVTASTNTQSTLLNLAMGNGRPRIIHNHNDGTGIGRPIVRPRTPPPPGSMFVTF
ncbi:leucine rich repeat domain-containing protein [Ditylenchus destructor]|nr:leucine rich repeat domain-containing protein [Ditylenchus destructor]